MTIIRKVIDGVTINQSLDLLLDSPQPKLVAQRRACKTSYETALGSLLTALIFSDVVAFDKDIVGSADHGPQAAHQLKELLNNRMPGFVEAIDIPKAELFIVSPEFPAIIAESTPRADSAVTGIYKGLWRDFIARDVLAYLGNDPSLADTDLDASEYHFRRDFFVTARFEPILRPLLNGFDKGTIDSLVGSAYSMSHDAISSARACKRAVDEYCRRCVLAHLLIGENLFYHADTAAMMDPDTISDIWTCPTRGTLILSDDAAETSKERETLHLVLPYILVDILSEVQPGPSLFDTLAETIARVRSWPDYKELRRLIKILRTDPQSDGSKDIEKFTKEIICAERAHGEAKIHVEPKGFGFGLVSWDSPVKTAFRRFRRARWAARKFVDRVGRAPAESAREAAKRKRQELLRELFPNTYS